MKNYLIIILLFVITASCTENDISLEEKKISNSAVAQKFRDSGFDVEDLGKNETYSKMYKIKPLDKTSIQTAKSVYDEIVREYNLIEVGETNVNNDSKNGKVQGNCTSSYHYMEDLDETLAYFECYNAGCDCISVSIYFWKGDYSYGNN